MARRFVTFVALVAGALIAVLFFACGGKIAPLDEGAPIGAGVGNAPSSTATAPGADGGAPRADASAGVDADDGGGGGGNEGDGGGDVLVIPLPPLDADTIPQCVDYFRDADPGRPSTTYPAFHPSMPQATPSGGPTMAPTPTIVPVTFSVDPNAPTILDYIGRLAASSWWSKLADYGIGAPNLVPRTITDPPLVIYDNGQIVDMLYAKSTGPNAVLPPPSPTTLFVVYLPPGIETSTYKGSAPGCTAFHYHYAPPNRPEITYAVVPNCGSYGGLTGMDAVTLRTAHVIAGGVTDPTPDRAPGWGSVDYDHYMWQYVWGTWFGITPVAEVTDLCSASFVHDVHSPVPLQTPDVAPYWVEELWSNSASRAQHAPCAPGDPYFAATPVVKDKVYGVINPGDYVNGTKYFHTRGLVVPPGSCRVVEIDLQSDRDLGEPIRVTAFESSSFYPSCRGTCVRGATVRAYWDRQQGFNGEKLHLTVEVFRDKGDGYSAVMIEATAAGRTTYWPLVLGYSPDR